MHAVGDVPHRHLARRPAGEEPLEERTAHLAVQSAHSVDGAAASDGEVGHVERLVLFRRGPSVLDRRLVTLPQGEEAGNVDAETGRIAAHILLHQMTRKAVETRLDRGVGREEVARSGGGHGHVEIHPVVSHEAAGPFEDGKGRMALVEMADVGLQTQLAQDLPAAYPQDHLLLKPHLRTASVELAGEAPVGGIVDRVVGIEQIEADPAGPDLPHAEADHTAGELEGYGQPFTIVVAQRHDGKLAGIVEGEELHLLPRGAERLPEVPLLPQKTDAHEGRSQIAGGLEEVAGQDAQAAAVDGQSLAEPELHAEVGDESRDRDVSRPRALAAGRGRGGGIGLGEPGGGFQGPLSLVHVMLDEAHEIRVGGELLQAGLGDGLQNMPGIVGALPQLGVEPLPDFVHGVAPRPAEIERHVDQSLEALGKDGERIA